METPATRDIVKYNRPVTQIGKRSLATDFVKITDNASREILQADFKRYLRDLIKLLNEDLQYKRLGVETTYGRTRTARTRAPWGDARFD